MKHTIFIFLVIITGTNFSWAQNVGIGTNAPHPSSKLEIKSDTSGLLMPRIDSPAVRINSPATGLMVYNSSANTPSYFNGSAWMNMGCSNFENFQHTLIIQGSNTVYNWTVPVGVTKIWIEGWSSGGGGHSFAEPNTEFFAAQGGYSGSYINAILPAIAGSLLHFSVPLGTIANTLGGAPLIIYDANNNMIVQNTILGPEILDTSILLIMSIPGQKGTVASFSFQQLGTTDFRKIIQCGNGGSSFLGGNGGYGTVISVGLPSGSVIGYSGGVGSGNSSYLRGAFPGGGGAAGYPEGGKGGDGLLIIRY